MTEPLPIRYRSPGWSAFTDLRRAVERLREALGEGSTATLLEHIAECLRSGKPLPELDGEGSSSGQ